MGVSTRIVEVGSTSFNLVKPSENGGIDSHPRVYPLETTCGIVQKRPFSDGVLRNHGGACQEIPRDLAHDLIHYLQ